MRRRSRLAIISLCMLTFTTCTPASAPDPGEGLLGAGAAGDAVSNTATPWRHWQPEAQAATSDPSTDTSPRPAVAGVVLALHGFNDYSNAFQDFAAFCRKRGIAVHAYDQRGFGANPDRGRWPGMGRLTGDLRQAVAHLRGIYGDKPLYVLGESMGGAVTIVTATEEEGLDADGLILSAPAVWGGKHMNLFYRMTLWFASTLAPSWSLSGGGLEIRPSDNIEMLRAFSADPLVIKETRTDAIAGLVALMDRALASAPKLDQDILLLTGDKDEIIPAGALDDFQDRLSTGETTTFSYPDGYHMLLRDLQRAKVFADVVAWIDDRSGLENPQHQRHSSKL